MKKTIIFIAAFFLLANSEAQQAHFGIKGGVNVSSFHYDNGGNKLAPKVGFNAGLLAHIHASKIWAIQPELLYSSEGGNETLIGGNAKAKTNLGYLNVPVLLQYMAGNGFRIEGGPQIGFLLSAKSKVNNSSTDIKNNYQSTSFSIPIGIGYITRSNLGVDARYVFGLSNISSIKNGTVIQSNVFQLGLFYQFSENWKHHK